MGQKSSKTTTNNTSSSLNTNEKKIITEFLTARGHSSSNLNIQDIRNLWKDILVQDLLKSYTEFLIKKYNLNKSGIGIDEFAVLYNILVKGDYGDKAAVLTSIICLSNSNHPSNPEKNVVSYNTVCKYVSDLLESFFLGLKKQNNNKYKSWTRSREPNRQTIEPVVIKGICADLDRDSGNIDLQDIESWLRCTGLVNTLHTYVLGSMYNLEPDESESTIIPLAVLPSSNPSTMLNLSQVVLLNSLLPSDQKVEWRFLFSTAANGESFSKFVGSIINQGPLLLVVKSNDNCTFGGYISENISPGPRWVGTNDSFLFKLDPSVEVYNSTGYNDHYVYLNMNQSSFPNGLGMGGQHNYWGLWIDSNYGEGETSETCTTYKNYKMLATKKKFRIENLEVWGVGEPPPTAEERGERTSTSALHKDPTATHILEMAGKELHSKNLSKAPREKH